ncbi:MAG: hypothetical protein A2493_02560 [Candidatus Magasanikbacteria bacterium RIFOXYC12_FULL_33_11]|uniref:Uncharacterized protein n=1 Tax=Candidatus Magasanikbacteria bacterium RIFOXYC12_FULL_33_11 TaxID=1798701 RepID=A0A1F6NPQ8_9BACT|nr:MAG: hypothetical protein A2493_02560 [Candidatus Magasanikbacteria bacterium RIFOXYC12_FULL_33_11]
MAPGPVVLHPRGNGVPRAGLCQAGRDRGGQGLREEGEDEQGEPEADAQQGADAEGLRLVASAATANPSSGLLRNGPRAQARRQGALRDQARLGGLMSKPILGEVQTLGRTSEIWTYALGQWQVSTTCHPTSNNFLKKNY